MATTDNLNSPEEDLPVNTTGEPTDQLAPEDDETETDDTDDTEDAAFDDEPIADDDEDLDDDEVKRLFPGEDSYSDNDEEDEDEEPYEGIRHGDQEDEGLVDDNMTGMPVIPSPS